MKFYKILLIILIIFFKTGNVLSDNNIFSVNNIELLKKGKLSNAELANKAIKKGFQQLIEKILLKDDSKKLAKLKLSQIKELVLYYQVSSKTDLNSYNNITYNIFFDKDKLHNLFYKMSISYSEILDKELFILPVLKKNNKIFIFNQNYFYDKWNEEQDSKLIEFILPLENIEIIEKVNINISNFLNIKLSDLFQEYQNKNLALVFIQDNNLDKEKVYIKLKILDKDIVKNIIVEKFNLNQEQFYDKIIIEVKKEITSTIKSKNLVDIRTPSFLNAKLFINKNSNLVQLKKKLKKIDLIQNIYVQEFNNEYLFLKIKYLGKLNKIITQLEKEKINLRLKGDQWSLEIIQ